MAEANYDQDLNEMILGASLPAPEFRTEAPEMTRNVDAPAALNMPGGSPWLDLFQTALAAAGAGNLLGSGSQQLGRLNQQLMEKRRVEKSSQETQALTALLSSALSSGDSNQVANAIKQMSGLKGLEPETVQSLQKIQLSLGQHIGEQAQLEQQNKAISEALVNGGMNSDEGQFLNSILKANPNMKPTDAVKFLQTALQAGLYEKAQTINVSGVGVVRVPGTFGRMSGELPKILVPADPNSGKELPAWDQNVQSAGLAEFTSTGKVSNARTLRALGLDPKDPESSTRAAEMLVKRSHLDLRNKLQEHSLQMQANADIRSAEREDAPINEKALFYVDPHTLANPSPDTSRKELGVAVREKRLVSVRPNDVQELRNMKSRVEQLLDMREIAQKILPKHGGENIGRGIQLAIRNKLATDVDATLFSGWGKALQLSIASDFNKGRPSDPDREAILGVVFNNFDTVQTALGKIDYLIKHYDRLAAKSLGGVSIDPRKTGSGRTVIPGATRRVGELPKGFE